MTMRQSPPTPASCYSRPLSGQRRSSTMQIGLKRAYVPADEADGARFLVDQLWPRGLKKESLPLQARA